MMVGGGFWAMNGLNSSMEGGRLGDIVGPRQVGVNQKEELDEIRASKIWKAIDKMNTYNYALRLILINVLPFVYCGLVLWGMCYLAEIEFDFRVVHTLTKLIYDHFHLGDKVRRELYPFDKLMNLFPREAGYIVYRFGPSGTMENHDARCEFPTHGSFEMHYLIMMYWLCVALWVMFLEKMVIFTCLSLYCWIASRKTSLPWHKLIVMYLLQKNVEPGVFSAIVEKSYSTVEQEHHLE